jgi:hypothetical protein
MADPTPFPVPSAPPADRAGDDPVYKPLSVVALAGFAVACVYGVFLLLCAIVAIYRGTPLLMSSITLLLPVAALILSLIGYLEVQRSDGTRAGTSFAVWGMLVSTLCGLAYVAYAAGTYLAVRNAADREIMQFVRHLQRGETDQAFRLTRGPRERPPIDENLHAELEQRFNLEGDAQMRGQLTTFELSEIALRLRQAGPEATIRAGGVAHWEYSEGGYKISLNYQVISPDGTGEFTATAHGRDPGKTGGRLWTIVQNETHTTGNPRLTPRGEQRERVRELSAKFLGEWMTKLSEGKLEEAFLDTVEPSKRGELQAKFKAGLAVKALGGGPIPLPPDPEAQRLAFLPGYRAFREGGLVKLAPDFWSPATLKDQVLPEIRQAFAKPADLLMRIQPAPASAAVPMGVEGDRVVIRYPVIYRALPRFTAEGSVVMEADAASMEPGGPAPEFWIKAYELGRAKTAPTPTRPPGM